MSDPIRSAEGSRERLERISHHFLSETSTPGRPGLFTIVSLTDAPCFPVTDLSRAFSVRGRPAVILDMDRGLQDVSRLAPSTPARPIAPIPPAGNSGGNGPAFVAEMLRQLEEWESAPEIRLLSVDAGAAETLSLSGTIVLAVPASREGVRQAFITLKKLSGTGEELRFGAVMVEAMDQDSARIHFERLATGAVRFLGLSVASYGYLPAPPPHVAVNLIGPQPHEQARQAALAGMVTLLLGDQAFSWLRSARRFKAKERKTPMGAAAQ